MWTRDPVTEEGRKHWYNKLVSHRIKTLLPDFVISPEHAESLSGCVLLAGAGSQGAWVWGGSPDPLPLCAYATAQPALLKPWPSVA